MEKICLARRRVERVQPRENNGFGREPEEEVISVGLTADQCRLIRTEEGFGISDRRPDTVFMELHQNDSGQIVFNFHFRRSETPRMLKPEHVREMLQIGRGGLAGLIRSGSLKCFRIGKSKRFLLADVMALLSRSEDKDALRHSTEIPAGDDDALPVHLQKRRDRVPVCERQTQAGS